MIAALVALAAAGYPTAFVAGTEIAGKVAALEASMKPGQGFAQAPLVSAGPTVAALEYWTAPGKPAVHPDEAEYATGVAGAGTLISGGTLVDAKVTRPGLTEGSRIEGGITRRLRPGDVLLIPAGVPHWFGIDGGKLVLLGTKIRTAAK